MSVNDGVVVVGGPLVISNKLSDLSLSVKSTLYTESPYPSWWRPLASLCLWGLGLESSLASSIMVVMRNDPSTSSIADECGGGQVVDGDGGGEGDCGGNEGGVGTDGNNAPAACGTTSPHRLGDAAASCLRVGVMVGVVAG